MDKGYLALDPGETTGWASFDKDGNVEQIGMIKDPKEFLRWLEIRGTLYKTVIVEDYKLFQRKALQQSGSDMVASRVIGGIESWADRYDVAVVKQPASIKKIAEMWSGKKPPSNHKYSHEIDAYNHGMYYLIRNKIRTPPA